jgi:hypothetical protein
MESLQVFIKTEEDTKKEDVATQDTESLEGEPCKESVKSKRSVLLKLWSSVFAYFANGS